MLFSLLVVFLFYYVIQAVLAFGLTYGYFQGNYPYFAWRNRREDAGFAIFIAILPIGAMLAFLMSGFGQFGLRYRPLSSEESWNAYHQRWPILSRKDWLGP